MEEPPGTRVPALRLPSSMLDFLYGALIQGAASVQGRSSTLLHGGKGRLRGFRSEVSLISKTPYDLIRMTGAPESLFVSRYVRIRDFRRRGALKLDDLRGRADRERLASCRSAATFGVNFVLLARGSLLNDFFRFHSRIRPFSRLNGLENVGSVSRRIEFSSFCTCQASRCAEK